MNTLTIRPFRHTAGQIITGVMTDTAVKMTHTTIAGRNGTIYIIAIIERIPHRNFYLTKPVYHSIPPSLFSFFRWASATLKCSCTEETIWRVSASSCSRMFFSSAPKRTVTV